MPKVSVVSQKRWVSRACFFHARGKCDPIMASNASGTANYGPRQIAALVGGRGVVAGVPTVVPM